MIATTPRLPFRTPRDEGRPLSPGDRVAWLDPELGLCRGEVVSTPSPSVFVIDVDDYGPHIVEHLRPIRL